MSLVVFSVKITDSRGVSAFECRLNVYIGQYCLKLRLILLLVEMTNHVKGRYSDAVVIGCECAGSLRTSAWRCISERDYAVKGHGA